MKKGWQYFKKFAREWGSKARKFQWPTVRNNIKEDTRKELRDKDK